MDNANKDLLMTSILLILAFLSIAYWAETNEAIFVAIGFAVATAIAISIHFFKSKK